MSQGNQSESVAEDTIVCPKCGELIKVVTKTKVELYLN